MTSSYVTHRHGSRGVFALVGVSCMLILLIACQTDSLTTSDASVPADDADGATGQESPTGTLFGATVSSYVAVSNGSVTAVGVRIPLSAIQAAPANGDVQDDLILDMPAPAKEQTFLSQLRVNWLGHGHGPAPYALPHADFHFFRGSSADIEAISCRNPAPSFPPEILTPDHEHPDTCVNRMGYHAWPTADELPGAAFTASLILGYTPTELVFIEPMITRDTLLAGRDFELAITAPERSGAARTRYPTRVRALYERDGLSFRLEFDRFVDLD